MGLWLRHTTGVTTTAMRFEELTATERQSVTRRIGTTLRMNNFDHVLGRSRLWTVVISADETFGPGSTKRAFLEDFFAGDARELALDASLTEPVSGWIAVAMEGGESPFELIEGNEYLPEYTFVLLAKEAS